MLNLSEINTFTNSRDGDIYSDLHKDVYGFRPRGIEFVSIEEFDADFKRLVEKLSEQQDEDEIRQTKNFERFVARVAETQKLVQGTDRTRAIEIIAEAEGEMDHYKFYGAERLEWIFDLKYGSIKSWLEAAQ